MKKANIFFEVLGFVYSTVGLYFTANLLHKLFTTGELINIGDISGIPWLIIGIASLIIFRQHNKVKESKEIKKTPFIWTMMVFFAISLGNINMDFIYDGFLKASFYLSSIVTVALVVITMMYIFKLDYLKKDVLKWTHIVFGIMIVGLVYQALTGQISNDGAVVSLRDPVLLITLAIEALVWILFYKHISDAVHNNKIVLND